MKTNEILLRRKHLILVDETLLYSVSTLQSNLQSKAMVVTMAKNVEAYGFTFSREVIEILGTYSPETLKDWYLDFIPKLKALVGADKEYHPMYPNFPQQVMEASEAELFWNAILHYFTYGYWAPQYEKDERLPFFDDVNLTTLDWGEKEDLMILFQNLLESKTNLSQQDRVDIEMIMLAYPQHSLINMPEEIPLKENVAFVSKLILEKSPLKDAKYIQKYFKTATDVLRLVAALSDGDISLAKKTKFRKLRRCERRMIMDLLVGCGAKVSLMEDMFRYKNEWIRVGEIIHPGEFKNARYNVVNEVFKALRSGDKPLMFAGKVQKAITEKDMKTAANLLKYRPGEFARQLDKLIRDAEDKNFVINTFASVAKDVSTPVLWQVRQHFASRIGEGEKLRVFFPKGQLAQAHSIPNELPPIEDKYCMAIVDICKNALIAIYKSKSHMGNVFIDPELRNYAIPFSQRSANGGSKIVTRGSRLPIKSESSIIRGFIWWTNTKDNHRVDIDLSVGFYDENWKFVQRVAYTNLRDRSFKSYHSGDITNGGDFNGKGVAEFLDFDIEAVSEKARYAVFQVYNYTCQNYTTMEHVRFGWMEREDFDSGEIFEPTTVEMSMDLTSDSTVCIPVIFDCKEKVAIWADMNVHMPSGACGGNNLESNLDSVTATCYALANMKKPTLYDLVWLSTLARGVAVTDRNAADIIFSNDLTKPVEITSVLKENDAGMVEEVVNETVKENVPIITAFDLDYYMGQLL